MGGAHDKASIFFIRADRSDHAAAVQDSVKQLLPGYEVRLPKDLMSQMTSSNVPFLGTFINVMIGIAVIVGFLVTFLSMYTTIIERTREIGVLKSLGASKTYIVQIIVSETTLLSIAGMFAGIFLSFALKSIIGHVYPSLPIHITTSWVVRAGLIAVAGGLLGASYPAWLSKPQRPGRSPRLRIQAMVSCVTGLNWDPCSAYLPDLIVLTYDPISPYRDAHGR